MGLLRTHRLMCELICSSVGLRLWGGDALCTMFLIFSHRARGVYIDLYRSEDGVIRWCSGIGRSLIVGRTVLFIEIYNSVEV